MTLPMSANPNPNRKAKLTLSLALGLLCISGIAAGITIARLYVSEKWIRHTYDVEVGVKDLESALGDVGRHRVSYRDSGTPAALQEFQSAVDRVPAATQRVRELVRDDPSEMALLERLESNANQRVAMSKRSVVWNQQNSDDPAGDLAFTSELARNSFDTAEITDQMRQNEDALMEKRVHTSSLLFVVALAILVASSVSSAAMFWLHYRLLNRELRERRAAEKQLRQLSGRLMQLQDEERRKFARELHDSLGQNLAVAKMTADALRSSNHSDPRYVELSAVLEEAHSQTRTISYLLHPPLLDELGFASAAKWLIDGYSKRTGIDVSVDISKQAERLPRDLELVLFRILQETLTNIQRHSKSARAKVWVHVASGEVTMLVRDFGQGIPKDMLANFENNGTQVGVGLAGIRERVMEFRGKWEIKSDGAGTEITVIFPVPPNSDAAPRQSQMQENPVPVD